MIVLRPRRRGRRRNSGRRSSHLQKTSLRLSLREQTRSDMRHAALAALLIGAAALGGCSEGVLDPQGTDRLRRTAHSVQLHRHHAGDRDPHNARHAWRCVLVSRFEQARPYLPDFRLFGPSRDPGLVDPDHDRAAGGRLSPGSVHSISIRPSRLPRRSSLCEVQVVSLDWKWLFIYPELGIASVNQLTIPVGHAGEFRADLLGRDEQLPGAAARRSDLHDGGNGDAL